MAVWRSVTLTMSSDRSIFDALKSVTAATITTVLLKKGLRNVWLRGTKPLQPRAFPGKIESGGIFMQARI